jgi:N-hydroxyarylamine O-acetyltransferase
VTATMDSPTPLDIELRDRYLARVGFDAPPEPTIEALVALHRANVERVPYETIWIAVGERRTIDPVTTMRILTDGSGSGGYCYHLNGAFSLLLEWLGFDVRRHFGGVQPRPTASVPEPVAGANGNHLAVTVDVPEHGEWLVDAGLGDGLHEPLPLQAGTYRQGPFTYGLRPSDANPGGWRFDHDPDLSFQGFDFRPGPVARAELQPRHEFLMTSPESGFVRVAMAQRRDASGVDSLRGRILTRVGNGDETEHEIADQVEWRHLLADLFGITLDGTEEAAIDSAWERICANHDVFLASRGR